MCCWRKVDKVLDDDGGDRGVSPSKERTEYKLFRRRKHVQREGDFVLVAFALQPVEEAGGVDHCD